MNFAPLLRLYSGLFLDWFFACTRLQINFPNI